MQRIPHSHRGSASTQIYFVLPVASAGINTHMGITLPDMLDGVQRDFPVADGAEIAQHITQPQAPEDRHDQYSGGKKSGALSNKIHQRMA